MDTTQTKEAFNAMIRVRVPGTLEQRLEGIAAERTTPVVTVSVAQVCREAFVKYVEAHAAKAARRRNRKA